MCDIAADAGRSLASKRDAVVDRQAKRDVVNEEKRRARVRRKVIEDIGARGVAFRQVCAGYQPDAHRAIGRKPLLKVGSVPVTGILGKLFGPGPRLIPRI